MKVLTLNNAWIPVDIIDYQDCFRLMCKEHAKALETIHDSYALHTMDSWLDLHMHEQYDKVHTISMAVPVPEIIVLTEYGKIPRRLIKLSKHNLLARDGFKCAYCDKDLDINSMTVDHIIPRSKGGQTTWENCISSCASCNHKKADAHPEGRFKLDELPKSPTNASTIHNIRGKIGKSEVPQSWKHFLYKK
jgi:5-methylcytosine-specific restriction endonuclease McrA